MPRGVPPFDGWGPLIPWMPVTWNRGERGRFARESRRRVRRTDQVGNLRARCRVELRPRGDEAREQRIGTADSTAIGRIA
jgi:hypothetical protein